MDDDTSAVRQQAAQALILAAASRAAAASVAVLVVKHPVKRHAAVGRCGVGVAVFDALGGSVNSGCGGVSVESHDQHATNLSVSADKLTADGNVSAGQARGAEDVIGRGAALAADRQAGTAPVVTLDTELPVAEGDIRIDDEGCIGALHVGSGFERIDRGGIQAGNERRVVHRNNRDADSLGSARDRS